MDLRYWLEAAVTSNEEWSSGFGDFARHPSLQVDDARFAAAFGTFTERLKDNYPFFHPATPGRCSSRRTRPPSSATSPRC